MAELSWATICPKGSKDFEYLITTFIKPVIYEKGEYHNALKQHNNDLNIDNLIKKLTQDIGKNKTRAYRFIHQEKEDTGGIAKKLLDFFLLVKRDPTTNTPYTCETYPICKKYALIWDNELSAMSKNEVEEFETRINMLVDECTIEFVYSGSTYSLQRLLTTISDKSLSKRMAVLSCIASVWRQFINAKKAGNSEIRKRIVDFSMMIFPEDSVKKMLEDNIMDTDSGTRDETDEQLADETLKNGQKLFENGKYDEAAREFLRILNGEFQSASDFVIANACHNLIKCNQIGKKRFGCTVETLRYIAQEHGFPYEERRSRTIRCIPTRSETNEEGLYVINCENEVSKHILATAPTNWNYEFSTEPCSRLIMNKTQRIILVNDDYNVNLNDALNVLDAVNRSITDNNSCFRDWDKLELYIRCDEEIVTPVLDTALSFFVENDKTEEVSMIRIFIIDEAKRSADYLYARHPLFYPVMGTKRSNNSINTVILTDNNDYRHACWLVREALWLLPRYNPKIKTVITVLSPHAADICSMVLSKCPGIKSLLVLDNCRVFETEFPTKFDDIDLPEIRFITTSFSSGALDTELIKLNSANEKDYYVVDANTDIEAIFLATKIREIAIRTAVTKMRITTYARDNAVVAVRCVDAKMSNLIKELRVPKEDERGYAWFNDYGLITYGSYSDQFSWDNLSGGVIEEMSQCIHLQYCSSQDKSQIKTKKARKAGLISYFRRLYARDSSFAAAVSMPYRLYEAGVSANMWHIRDNDTYWDASVREQLAKEYNIKLFGSEDSSNCTASKELLNHLAKYEHFRWCCYMLSRGYFPASSDQVTHYAIAGSTRHSLQIARMHPCICSWDDLYELQMMLEYECNERSIKSFSKFAMRGDNYDYFQKLDYDNILHTDEIIRTDWFPQNDSVEDREE